MFFCFSLEDFARSVPAHLLDPEFSSSSSSAVGGSKTRDSNYDPALERRRKKNPCVKCGNTVKHKVCKVCRKPCHQKCGISDPGITDPLFNPLGPPVTCLKCNYLLQQRQQAAANVDDTTPEQQGDVTEPAAESRDLSFPSLTSQDHLIINNILADSSIEALDPLQSPLANTTTSSFNTPGPSSAPIGQTSTSTPLVGEKRGRKRKLSPLSKVRPEVAERRSARLSTYLITLQPPEDSDDSIEDARPVQKKPATPGDETNDDSDDSDPDFEQVRKRVPSTTKSSRGIQTTSSPAWDAADMPSAQKINIQDDDMDTLRLKVDLADVSKMTPAQYLQLFFDREILTFIVEQSIIYHNQKELRCEQLSIGLLARFLGFLLYAGCVPLPGKEYYWKSSTRQQMVAEHLSRNEMHAVKAQIHFANNLEQPRDQEGKPIGRFFKVENLVKRVNANFVKVVHEELCVAVDEQMTVYKGTKCPTGLKQYMPSKPIPHGFKNWARGGVSGYIYEMTFYTGKEEKPVSPAISTRQTPVRPEPTDEFDHVKLQTAQVTLKNNFLLEKNFFICI